MMRAYIFTIVLILFVLSSSGNLFATHIRAGDLTAERLPGPGLSYKFTATIYTDDAGVPPDAEIDFDFGTGEPMRKFPRVSFMPVGNATTKNIYEAFYTFAGPGEYKVGVYIRNRNDNIRNIPNSVNVAFYIESTFLITPFLGFNRSPVLQIPPIDFAARGRIFIHNPGAYDADGDSLAYKMTVCKKAKGQFVDGYIELPVFGGMKEDGSGPTTLTLDPIKGDLVWNTPGQVGQYNVAFIVEEWRDGILIGQVNRDMQIFVRDNPNRPPVINPLDTCITAGMSIGKQVVATDPDRDFVSLSSFSELYPPLPRISPKNHAIFELENVQPPNGRQTADFFWRSVCEDVRRVPYLVHHKAEDQPPRQEDKLAGFSTWAIRVVGPKPDTLIAIPDVVNASVTLQWISYRCPNAAAMTVWRREGSFPFEPDTCQTGLPSYTGYKQIGQVPIGTLTYTDRNLQRGKTYCYRIFAVFPEPQGGEGYTSMEVCVFIPSIAPYITNVSVEKTDKTSGEMFVRWTKPVDINPLQFPRPYNYLLYRAQGAAGGTYTQVGGVFAENDTTFTDTGLNTENFSYNYRIVFLSNNRRIDSSVTASNPRLTLTGTATDLTLSWSANVPWINNFAKYPRHAVYMRNELGEFELLDSTNVVASGYTFKVTKDLKGNPLQPKRLYCFYVKTAGTYNMPKIREPLLNKSQIVCGALLDNTPPCPPVKFALLNPLDCDKFDPTDPTHCGKDSLQNVLTWFSPNDEQCDDEDVSYRIYFAAKAGQPLELIATVRDTFFVHRQFRSLAGCYQISAIDGSGNETARSAMICLDNCPYFRLPNVFTPNGDGKNDLFRTIHCPLFVESVEFTVYNRWEQKIYEGKGDIFVNWDGRTNAGGQVPSGVYYYEAKVRFIRLNPDNELKIIKGWIQILGTE